jgi:hypothetical protein
MSLSRMKLWLGRTIKRPGTVIVCARSQVRARELLEMYLSGQITATEFKGYWSELTPGGMWWPIAIKLACDPAVPSEGRTFGGYCVREGVWLHQGDGPNPNTYQFDELVVRRDQ